MAEEQRHENTLVAFRDVFPDDPPSQPVWTGMPEAERLAREAILAEPYEPLADDEADVVLVRPFTLRRAAEKFLGRLEKKVGRDQRSPGTYWWYERELRLCLVPAAIDPAMPVAGLTLDQVEKFCGHWCDLNARSAETRKGSFGWRSAHNRLDAFAALLRDLNGRIAGYVYPPRADETFEEHKGTVAGDLTAICVYDAARLRSTLAAADDRLQLAVYCALNFGMYQCDIGQAVERVAIDWITNNGPVQCGDIRYSVGVQTTVRCVDPKRCLNLLLAACHGDYENIAEYLRSDPFTVGGTAAIPSSPSGLTFDATYSFTAPDATLDQLGVFSAGIDTPELDGIRIGTTYGDAVGAAVAVPEPTSIGAVAIGAAAVLLRRKRDRL